MFPALNHDPRHGTEDLRDLRAEQVAIHPASQLEEVATRLAHPQHEGTHEPRNGGRGMGRKDMGNSMKKCRLKSYVQWYYYVYIYIYTIIYRYISYICAWYCDVSLCYTVL